MVEVMATEILEDGKAFEEPVVDVDSKGLRGISLTLLTTTFPTLMRNADLYERSITNYSPFWV